MQDLIDEGLIGAFLFAIGFAFIFKRGFSYWFKREPDKFPPSFFRLSDFIGGGIFCLCGVALIVKAIIAAK